MVYLPLHSMCVHLQVVINRKLHAYLALRAIKCITNRNKAVYGYYENLRDLIKVTKMKNMGLCETKMQ